MAPDSDSCRSRQPDGRANGVAIRPMPYESGRGRNAPVSRRRARAASRAERQEISWVVAPHLQGL